MIEFNGYISGAAEKHFFKRQRCLARNTMLVSFLLLLPAIVIFSMMMNSKILINLYCVMIVAIIFVVYIPKSKKEKFTIIPKKIFTENDEFIVSVTDKYQDIKRIIDAKEVRDYGEFYEIVFPFGKVSEKFICQKSLLTKGTLEDFELLFEGKIVKKNK